MSNTILITGATSGIGKAVALKLGRLPGIHIILVARNKKRGRAIEKRLEATCSVDLRISDVSSVKQMQSLAHNLCNAYQTIDVLVNNAGARFDQYYESDDGIELTFATNHLGHFVLARHLLNSLKEPPKRVINVSSSAHRQARPEVGWNCSADRFDRKIAYANSKLANILFTNELSRRWRSEKMISFAVDPGPAATRFARNNGGIAWAKHLLAHAVAGDLGSAREGAGTIAYLATNQSLDGFNGKLVRGRNVIEPSQLANDRELAAELWQESETLADSFSDQDALA